MTRKSLALSNSASPRPVNGDYVREAPRGLASARVMARAWITTVPDAVRQQTACSFITAAIARYVELAAERRSTQIPFSSPAHLPSRKLNRAATQLARAVGEEVVDLPIADAAYQLSATYTALVPDAMRSDLGMYYTPPALTERLLDMAERAGVDFRKARVLDPACGGGAFLLPVALRMRRSLSHLSANDQLQSITKRLRGFEIDPFAAWITQTWLSIALADLAEVASTTVPPVVEICDTLEQNPDALLYDLVVGNPPYGRITLSDERRSKFARSLYGHANLYGVFTDIAVRWTQPGGTIAFVTPPSFLSGQYFQALRSLMANEAPPVALDFIESRKGVFEDVLQETILATYVKGRTAPSFEVHRLETGDDLKASVEPLGSFCLPDRPSSPWLAPRNIFQAQLLAAVNKMPGRLSDLGYSVSTGPLVWNRRKEQMRARVLPGCFPIVWAEAITSDGSFVPRSDRRTHQPYFQMLPGDEPLKVTTACVLVQRTTSKEQSRRLVAALMPHTYVREHGAVIVENHLNMVRPTEPGGERASLKAMTALLNSRVVDAAFRCISGSVAVSAFELEALPMPSPSRLTRLERLVNSGASREKIESEIMRLYGVSVRP